uniref:Uncharacterized protein n=1 Tax=Triticum urartu TaxID=4572 RepID=A0A8R7QUW9_TRIUA
MRSSSRRVSLSSLVPPFFLNAPLISRFFLSWSFRTLSLDNVLHNKPHHLHRFLLPDPVHPVHFLLLRPGVPPGSRGQTGTLSTLLLGLHQLQQY